MSEKRALWYFLFMVIFFANPCTCEDQSADARHERMIMEIIDIGLLLLDVLTTASQYLQPNKVEEYMDKNPQDAHLLAQIIKNSIIQAKEESQLKYDLDKLTENFRKIDLYYARFKQLKQSKLSARYKTVSSYINQMLDLNHGPIDILDSINSFVLTPRSKPQPRDAFSILLIDDFLTRFFQHTKGYENVCNRHKSQQQMFLVLFTSFVTAEAKAWLVLDFCYKKLAQLGQVNYKVEMKNLENLLERRMYNITNDFSLYMSHASRDVWRCDPPKYDKGSSYVEFEGLFQRYVTYEQTLVNYTMKEGKMVPTTEGTCDNTCSDYKNAVSENNCIDFVLGRGVRMKFKLCLPERKCEGPLYRCESFGKETELWTCSGDSENTKRRYMFMINEGKNARYHYGPALKEQDCPNRLSYNFKISKWFNLCDFCVCTCHDQSDNVYINMEEAVADPKHVITGVRLLKEGHHLHIQIQQAVLFKKGHVIPDTVHWKNISYPKSENRYRTFNWLNTRKIYLGIDELPDQQVLTGLKFVFMKNGPREYMLGFETRSMLYNFKTATLKKAEKTYDINRFQEAPIPAKNQVSVDEADIQPNSLEPSTPQPDYVMIVKLTTSNFNKDLGQSTIPFVDIQPVITNPPMPLSGAGFYLKNTEGYGGYLAVQIRTLDVSSYISQ